MKVLVIDVGGSHVKLLATGRAQPISFASGKRFTPDRLIAEVKHVTSGWEYDVVSLGYPGEVGHDGPVAEPGKLGTGWVGYDFNSAFGRPVRILNDAAMQALGGYDGGRMLFIGLGTGLGSALIAERVVVPLELGILPYGPRDTIADRLGREGLARHGKDAWLKAVAHATGVLRRAFAADYVLLGGGNASKVRVLPDRTRRGGNDDAFTGGFRIWEERVEPHDAPPSSAWRVVE